MSARPWTLKLPPKPLRFCDCGQPAVKRKNQYWVCAVCDEREREHYHDCKKGSGKKISMRD